MHGNLPYLAKQKDRPREQARVEKQRRETIISRIARILDRGEPTRFAFEGACRHGVRSALCLDGIPWQPADKFAAAVVEEALRRLGAARPTWEQAQSVSEYGRERFFCERCGKPIPEERYGHGHRVRFCSKLCNIAARSEKARRCGERISKAEFAARLAANRERRIAEQTRPCEQCGKPFTSRDPLKRFCSVPCANDAKVVSDDQRVCEQCGKTFTQKRWRDGRYCSLRCMGDAMVKPRPMRTCAHCGKEYVQKYLYQDTRFCSRACSGAANRKVVPEVQCEQCATVFRPKYTWAKPRFCSRTCKHEAQRKPKPNSFDCEAAE